MKGIRRRAFPILVGGLALMIAGTVAGGAVIVLSSPDTGLASAGKGPGGRGAGPSDGAQDPVRIVPVSPAMAIAPLNRVVPPDVLAVAQEPLDAKTLRKISGVRGVREVTAFDGGAVRLRGRFANVFGVDPSTFRAWTPPSTATATELWTALARDQFVVSFEARRAQNLELGEPYYIEGRKAPRVRLDAAASLGLPGVDALVSKRTSQRLGLVRDLGVLVNAPGTDMNDLTTALRELLGKGAQIIPLRGEAAPGGLPTEAAPRGKPGSYLDLYKQAATRCPGLSWTVLAAIGQIESGHGRNNGPSTAGALGPMQFMPGTWAAYGVDGDGDNRADIMNPYDAVPSAAAYLCANGAGRGGGALANAIWHYNHAWWYVREVLSLARDYAANYD
ncbi:MAG: transglycosylase SLT domain-containing protein [Streptosporangiales bacterium]|nr:transglycosylase SLT domain-containing protein [Streptosporangiales bacterium]